MHECMAKGRRTPDRVADVPPFALLKIQGGGDDGVDSGVGFYWSDGWGGGGGGV